MAVVNQVTLRNLIRLEVGNVGQDDLPDQVVDSKIRMTVQRIVGVSVSSESSEARLGQIDTVSGQQTYEIPPGRIVDEIFPVIPSNLQSSSGGAIVGQVPANASFTKPESYWRSDELMNEIRRIQLERNFNWTIIANQIWVDPIPDADGEKIYYTYFEVQQDADASLPLKYERAMLLGACADVYRYLGNRYRNRSVPFRNAGLQEFNNSDTFETKAQTYEELFNSEVMRVSVGV